MGQGLDSICYKHLYFDMSLSIYCVIQQGFLFCFDGKLFDIGTIQFLIEKIYLLSDIDNFSPFGERYSAILFEEYLISIPLLPLFPKRYSSAF